MQDFGTLGTSEQIFQENSHCVPLTTSLLADKRPLFAGIPPLRRIPDQGKEASASTGPNKEKRGRFLKR